MALSKQVGKTVDQVVETDFLVQGAGVVGGVVLTNVTVAQIRSFAAKNPENKILQAAATWARAVAGGVVAVGGTMLARGKNKTLKSLGVSIGVGGASQLVVGVLQGTGVIPEQFRSFLPSQAGMITTQEVGSDAWNAGMPEHGSTLGDTNLTFRQDVGGWRSDDMPADLFIN